MIKELNHKDRSIILNMKNTPNALKIKGYFLAYGCGRSFIRFFADEPGDIVIAVKDNTAYLYLADNDKAAYAAEFLCLITTCVVSDKIIPPLCDVLDEIGSIYQLPIKALENKRLANISDSIECGRIILEKVFPLVVNSTTYPIWFTDISHRIRHKISRMYTYEGICTATVFSNIGGLVYIVQLATLEEHRGKGYAAQLLCHIATEEKARTLIVLSQNAQSDKFYEKNKFEYIGEWYCYDWLQN